MGGGQGPGKPETGFRAPAHFLNRKSQLPLPRFPLLKVLEGTGEMADEVELLFSGYSFSLG